MANWNSVQILLKEEGYEDAKLLYICMCNFEKEKTRSGKTTSTISYTGKYSVVENKDDLCVHCGKKPYMKYYYLGLSTKVKNWFKSLDMCKKMLSHWEAREHWLGHEKGFPEKWKFGMEKDGLKYNGFGTPIVHGLCQHCVHIVKYQSHQNT